MLCIIFPVIKNTSAKVQMEGTDCPPSSIRGICFNYFIVEMSGNQMINRFIYGFKTVIPNQWNWCKIMFHFYKVDFENKVV